MQVQAEDCTAGQACPRREGVVIGYISRSTGNPIQAVLFDTFGTVVDWRTGVAREVQAFLDKHGIDGVDPLNFADAWRARYQPAMQTIRDGRRDFVPLDVLHLENLRAVLAECHLSTPFPPEELWQLTTAWHRVYKPQPAAYTAAADLLGLRPSAVMLVAAHNSDLVAARGSGLATAFLLWATEHGPHQTTDLAAAADWDITGATLSDVAEQLTTDR